MTQYALAGIKNYWIVWLQRDDSAVDRIEEWRLDEEQGLYVQAAGWTSGATAEAIDTQLPFAISATWADLEF